MWVPSIWFNRCLTRQPCEQPHPRPLRRATHRLRLVTDRFEALGEFALSSWFEWCQWCLLWWPESLFWMFWLAASNGAVVRVGFPVTAPPSRPWRCREPSKIRSTAMIRRYPFGHNFAKEPLTFIILEPIVQNVKTKSILFFWKRISSQ
jgi:hypothetical protein